MVTRLDEISLLFYIFLYREFLLQMSTSCLSEPRSLSSITEAERREWRLRIAQTERTTRHVSELRVAHSEREKLGFWVWKCETRLQIKDNR